MKTIGICRRIDDLGRIVIPREVRERIFGKADASGEPMDFFIEGDSIVLKPYKSAEQKVREKAIDDFAERLKDFVAKNVEDAECSDDLCCEIFQSEIDEIAEKLKSQTEF